MARKLIAKLRDFPSVEELLGEPRLHSQVEALPRPVASRLIKEAVREAKEYFKKSKGGLTTDDLYKSIEKSLKRQKTLEIGRIINATGIVVHTNLGRAPLPEELFDHLREHLSGYGNIEFDSDAGKRFSRGAACEDYLATLTSAESATVVNNCAASLFITLNTLANRKKVIISRGEMVQIGGGFRIRDILKKSGARLSEVGSTNITTIQDYEAAIDDKTALILKVHKSNFVQAGFTEEVELNELVALAKRHNLPLINDLGSGALVSTREILGYDEPGVAQSVRAGTDLTLFSGDKMLGGPQAGLIVGRSELVSKIKKNPLFRTLRVDKIVLSMLEHLFRIYLNGTHTEQIKLWRLLAVSESNLYSRGKEILSELSHPPGVNIEATRVFVGGGTQPKQEIASVAICFGEQYKSTRLALAFRKQSPPILGRVEKDRFMLDLKAVDSSEIDDLINGVRAVLDEG